MAILQINTTSITEEINTLIEEQQMLVNEIRQFNALIADPDTTATQRRLATTNMGLHTARLENANLLLVSKSHQLTVRCTFIGGISHAV